MISWMYTFRALDLDACFVQQGVKFTEVWHMITHTLGHTHTHTHTHMENTQGPVD